MIWDAISRSLWRYGHAISNCAIRKPEYTSLFINTLRPRHSGHHFPDDLFKCIFLNEDVSILVKISLKFVSEDPINNIPALVQIMACRRPGDKPLSEPMMASLSTHICVTWPHWVKVVCSVSSVPCYLHFCFPHGNIPTVSCDYAKKKKFYQWTPFEQQFIDTWQFCSLKMC